MARARFSRSPVASAHHQDDSQLHKFDKTDGDGKILLVELVGQEEVDKIIAKGRLEFVATGDTGKGANTKQEEVVKAMSRDVDVHHPENGPIFFFNLGDVIYGSDKDSLYANKFYRPNMNWLLPQPGFQGIIVAIPGNHDGEVRDTRDKPSLRAFQENFCKNRPPLAESFEVKMPNLPGVYWWLDAPFVDVIGLYSNAAENFGILNTDDDEPHQLRWLKKSLKAIADDRSHGQRKALVIATHHPPYSQGFAAHTSGHPGSPQMLAQIDEACEAAGVWPDMFISGHSHNYQLYKRRKDIDGHQALIHYIIAGTGGIGSQPVSPNINATDSTGKVTYASGRGKLSDGSEVYGYLRIRATTTLIQSTFVQTLSDHRHPIETVAVDLATLQETTPEFD